MSLLACPSVFAATFEKLNGGIADYVTLQIKSEAPGVEIVILDRSGQEVRSGVVEIRHGVAKYDVPKRLVPFTVQLRDLTEKELGELQWGQGEEARKVWRKLDEPSIGQELFLLFLVIASIMLISIRKRQKQHKTEETISESFQGTAIHPIPDLATVTEQVLPLIQPLVHAAHREADLVVPFSAGSHEAFLCEWSSDANPVHAYVILGLDAPYVRVTPKRLFPDAVDEYGGPDIAIHQDPTFSKAFRVQGRDVGAIRRYLRPELRRVLLTHGGGWRFHAGPEGIALVKRGRTHPHDAHEVKAILEGIVRVIEPASDGRVSPEFHEFMMRLNESTRGTWWQ